MTEVQHTLDGSSLLFAAFLDEQESPVHLSSAALAVGTTALQHAAAPERPADALKVAAGAALKAMGSTGEVTVATRTVMREAITELLMEFPAPPDEA